MKSQFPLNGLFLSGIIIFFLTTATNAQYAFSPSTILMKNQTLDTLTYDSIHIANNSGSTLFLDWKLISSDTIGGSYFDFCGSGNCFLGIPDSGSLPPIGQGQFGWIGMHLWTGHFPGTCTAKLWVFQQGNPGIGDTLTFILNATGANGIDVVNKSDEVTIGPNPSSGIIQISNLKSLEDRICIRNSVGEAVYSSNNTFNTEMIDLGSLSTGIYFIEIYQQDDFFARKIVLNK